MVRNKIIEKAWGINWHKIEEGDYYSGNIDHVYAGTRGKAKSLLLPEICDYKLCNGDDVTFINMPIERKNNSDKCKQR